MYYTKNTTVFLDGKWIKADQANTSLYDQTLHYGNGVFEGIRSYKSENGTYIFKAEEHFERLLQSAKKMHIPVKYTVRELVKISYELLEKNNLLTFGTDSMGFLIFLGFSLSNFIALSSL